MIKTTDFVNDPVVRARLDGLKRDCGEKPFSDIVDDQGHQYVDLVLGGGGTLGVALLGYTYALEEMGIRFLGLGGTSAGAINAVLLAAAASPQGERSRLLIPVLADLPCKDFVDSDSREVCDLIFEWVDEGASFSLLDLLAGKYLVAMYYLVKHYGLNGGSKFLAWLSSVLGSFEVRTTRELTARMAQRPSGLSHREGKPLSDSQSDAHLALVATEVTTESKIVFPEMSRLFWDDPDQVDPAVYVRASMSIPFFYQPLRVKIAQGPQAIANWGDLAKYTGPLPSECLFVDGGVMSNFPIDLFHIHEEVPAAPTFGVKLGKDQRQNRVDTAAGLVWAIFNSARHCLDRDFLAHHPDYQYLVATVDTAQHSWLQFDMSNEEKLDLFRHGVEAAATFLEGFNWEHYKRVRKELKQAAVEVARPPQTVLQPVKS
jgi:NTE family protein